MGKRLDLTNKKFGKLTALYDDGRDKYGNRLWNCSCECGNETVVRTHHLTTGQIQSCGCGQVEGLRKSIKENRHPDLQGGTKISLLNSKIPITNTSGYKGVTWNKKRKKWQAQIQFKKKNYFLGYFDDKEEAYGARKAAEDQLFNKVNKRK